jgi:alpha-ketoglutarate-dependent taurine dioxygenase
MTPVTSADDQSCPLSAGRLTTAERKLRTDGYAVIVNAGVVIDGHLDADRALALAHRFGVPSCRDGGTALWPVRAVSSDPRETFSRRAGAAALHTDSAYHDQPESRFLLICVRPARDGGITRLLHAEDARSDLDEPVRELLSQAHWRWRRPAVFGGGRTKLHSVLEPSGEMRWRSDNLVIPPSLRSVARTFHSHLERHPNLVQVGLAADSVLVCDNRRTLHGRTAFVDPARWLVRIRLDHR